MSDHISGPRALADPIADITDVYAFPSPESPGRLVMVMNTLPFAKPFDAFSEGLVYRFRLRPLSAGEGDDALPFVPDAQEFVFDCVFSHHTHADGDERVEQSGTCTTPGGETVEFRVNDVEGGAAHGVHVFAGVRWDPFMMDAPAALKTIATGKLQFTDPSSIYLDGKNVLSLVVEIDCALLGGAELVGLVAETLTRGAFNVRIERVGRPEVKNMMLAPKQFDTVNRDLEIRDLYMRALDAMRSTRRRATTRAPTAHGSTRNLAPPGTAWTGKPETGPLERERRSRGRPNWCSRILLVVDVTKPDSEQGSRLEEIELAAAEAKHTQPAPAGRLNDDVDGRGLHAGSSERRATVLGDP